jgi:hypothetical protein
VLLPSDQASPKLQEQPCQALSSPGGASPLTLWPCLSFACPFWEALTAMTSTRRAELQQNGELQSGELRKNLLINLGFMRRFCFVIHPSHKKKQLQSSFEAIKRI